MPQTVISQFYPADFPASQSASQVNALGVRMKDGCGTTTQDSLGNVSRIDYELHQVDSMMRAGNYFGTLDYKTDTIPTLGASHSPPHREAIIEISKRITVRQQERHPVRAYLKRLFKE